MQSQLEPWGSSADPDIHLHKQKKKQNSIKKGWWLLESGKYMLINCSISLSYVQNSGCGRVVKLQRLNAQCTGSNIKTHKQVFSFGTRDIRRRLSIFHLVLGQRGEIFRKSPSPEGYWGPSPAVKCKINEGLLLQWSVRSTSDLSLDQLFCT